MRLLPDPFTVLARTRRALRTMGRVVHVHDRARWDTEHVVREIGRGGARRRRGREVTVLVRCGLCDVVLDELHGSPDGADMRAVGHGDHIDAFAGAGRPTHGSLLRQEDVPGLLRSSERRRYRCPRRGCTGDHPVQWQTLTEAFRVAAARPAKRDRVIRLPADLAGG